MTDLYKNKYRISSARLQNWNYGWNGAYFVTICTKDRENYFGYITGGEMQLSGMAAMAQQHWNEIPAHFPFVNLGAFVVMPNHVHGIIIIDKSDGEHNVETRHALSLQSEQQEQSIGQKRFQNQGKNTISPIIGAYKSAITKHAHQLGYEFAWQPRFHDHIIRNEKSFRTILEYIIHNPGKWIGDRYHNK